MIPLPRSCPSAKAGGLPGRVLGQRRRYLVDWLGIAIGVHDAGSEVVVDGGTFDTLPAVKVGVEIAAAATCGPSVAAA